MGRIVSGILLTLLTFAALGPPIGGVTFMLEILLVPDHGLPTLDSGSILDTLGKFLVFTAVAMLFSYGFVKTALVCGMVAIVVRVVIRRTDIQIGLITLAGAAVGVPMTLVPVFGAAPVHLTRDYLLAIALCAVPTFACAWISRPRRLAARPVASPIIPDARLPF